MSGIFVQEYLHGQHALAKQVCAAVVASSPSSGVSADARRACEILVSDDKGMLRDLEQFCQTTSDAEGLDGICALTVPVRHCVNVVSVAHTQATGKAVAPGSREEQQIMLACGMIKGVTRKDVDETAELMRNLAAQGAGDMVTRRVPRQIELDMSGVEEPPRMENNEGTGDMMVRRVPRPMQMEINEGGTGDMLVR
jgi:hypothetical protein